MNRSDLQVTSSCTVAVKRCLLQFDTSLNTVLLQLVLESIPLIHALFTGDELNRVLIRKRLDIGVQAGVLSVL